MKNDNNVMVFNYGGFRIINKMNDEINAIKDIVTRNVVNKKILEKYTKFIWKFYLGSEEFLNEKEKDDYKQMLEDEEHHIELFLLWLQQNNYQIKRGKK